MFEMPAILRSYYDPVILCCVLRWLRSTEMWWGDVPRDGEVALTQAIRRTGESELPMLLAELLLAGAQDKLPPGALEVVRADATILAERLGAPQNAALELGLRLTES
jgi:hypothetical protein